MSASASSAASRAMDDGFECTVAAYATVDAPLESIPALRENPGSASSPPLPPRFLRYADEQGAHVFSLVDCVLLGRKPLDMIREEIPRFREESLSLAYSINTPARETTRGRVVLPVEQRYAESSRAVDMIVDDVRRELKSMGGYGSFVEECAGLAKLGDSLSQRLTKYVGQYVQSVDI